MCFKRMHFKSCYIASQFNISIRIRIRIHIPFLFVSALALIAGQLVSRLAVCLTVCIPSFICRLVNFLGCSKLVVVVMVVAVHLFEVNVI